MVIKTRKFCIFAFFGQFDFPTLFGDRPRPRAEFLIFTEVQRSQNAVDWKGTSESYGACTTAGAIKCVDVVIISTCILTFLSDLWYKASQIHRSGSRRQELSGTFILGITSAHALSSPQAIDKGKTCGPCTHRYSASNRRCQLDSLRDNEGDVHSHNRQG